MREIVDHRPLICAPAVASELFSGPLSIRAPRLRHQGRRNEMTTDTTLSPELVTAAPRGGGLWGLVREALAGTRHDFTTLPVRRAVLLLAIPMVTEMLWSRCSRWPTSSGCRSWAPPPPRPSC